MLTCEQVEQYHHDGFIMVEGVYDGAFIEELRQVTESFVQKSRTVTDHTDVFDLEPGHTADTPRLRRLKEPVKQHDAYRRALHDTHMLDIVEQLIGPGVRFQESKLNIKSARFGSAVEWHQDFAFYPHTNDDLLAVGVAVDDMTVDNGAMMVIPGAHKGPTYDHHEDGCFVGAITDPVFSDQNAVPMELKAGGVTIHHVRMPHGSMPNRSSAPRRFLLFQFCAVDAWPLMDVPDWESYNKNILRGEPTHEPRVEPVPVRIPLPANPTVGSSHDINSYTIYDIQGTMRNPVLAHR